MYTLYIYIDGGGWLVSVKVIHNDNSVDEEGNDYVINNDSVNLIERFH